MDNTAMMRIMGYEALTREIKKSMGRSAAEAVRLGFLLRQVQERGVWTGRHGSFPDYLRQELHMDYTMASRLIKINRKYSLGGDSTDIDPGYSQYSQGVLVEMLNMGPEEEAKVTPGMTVKEVREVKRQAKKGKEKPGKDPGRGLGQGQEETFQQKGAEDFPGAFPEAHKETVIDGEYREVPEASEGEVATPQPESAGMPHDGEWFVREYVEKNGEEAGALYRACLGESSNIDRAKAVQMHIASYGDHYCGCSGHSFHFHSFAKGLDIRIGQEAMHLSYNAFVRELMVVMADTEMQDGETAEAGNGMGGPADGGGDILASELAMAKKMLADESELLDDYTKFDGIPETTVLRQKTIVAALGALIRGMEAEETEEPEETGAPGETVQPELPALRNNDQRKEWLKNYKAWGLWYRDENIDVNYYKYDFQDGSRLVVAEYLQRSYYNGEPWDYRNYHLLEIGKPGREGMYGSKYQHYPDSESSLVEFLKKLQKKG